MITEFLPRAPGSNARTTSRPGPTATSGSPRTHQDDRQDHPDGSTSPSSPPGYPQRTPSRDHRRARRQPLVHRAGRQPDRPDHARRGRHRVRDRHHPAPARRRSRPGPTATSGSPRRPATDRPDHPGRRGHRVRGRHHRRTSTPHGITAGPDGNLWFTEPDGDRDRADHARRRRHRVRLGITAGAPSARHHRGTRTATSGSPRSTGKRSVGINTAQDPPAFSNPAPIAIPAGAPATSVPRAPTHL